MHSYALVPRRLAVQALLAACAFGVPAARAQDVTVRGVVLDSARTPVPQVTVSVAAAHQAARTDATGRFTLSHIPVGDVEISIRRIGFDAATFHTTVPAAGIDSMTLVLSELPQPLDTVAVSDARRPRRQGYDDFLTRRAQHTAGVFFTREEILKQRASTPSDLMRTVPGLRLVSVPGGKGIRFLSTITVRRGSDCRPVMWLDGQAAPGMELDEVPLGDIEGIELYRGASSTPPQFWRPDASLCGAIVIWTRIPGKP